MLRLLGELHLQCTVGLSGFEEHGFEVISLLGQLGHLRGERDMLPAPRGLLPPPLLGLSSGQQAGCSASGIYRYSVRR